MSFSRFREQCEALVEGAALERPPKGIASDLAMPCFSLAKTMRKAPQAIAQDIASSLKPHGFIREIRAEGPYVNFYADWSALGAVLVRDILGQKDAYGRGHEHGTIMVEYSSPNTNKPLHVGHLRNDALGMAVSNLLEFAGHTVLRTAIINDRGVHICKSMYAYGRWGKRRKPDKKPDHFVGDFYVLFEQKRREDPELEEEIQVMLRKWETGDRKTRALWKQMNAWVLRGMKETYKAFGSRFDFWTYESRIYDKAKPVIDDGLAKGIFSKNEKGDVVATLEPDFPNKTVLRADGTSVYITQDMALARMRFGKYHLDKLIYVVASEQNLHFQQLFSIFEKLGYSFAERCHHLSYGLVNLPSGRMKTREGTVIDADDLIAEVTSLAREEVEKRGSRTGAGKRAKAVALAAIKYYLLKTEPAKDLLFEPRTAISFEGDTGPYLLYTYARAKSILRKSRKKAGRKLPPLGPREVALLRTMAQFEPSVQRSAGDLKPHILANYLFELATGFNEYYHAERIIGSKHEASLLGLVEAVSTILKTGLRLLNIETVERM